MTAKPRQQSTAAQSSAPGQPGSLMGNIQAEVAAEASPMLLFLTKNAKSIAVFIILFIAGIVGYWFYAAEAEKSRQEEILSLGKILLLSDQKTRLEQLEGFVASAPDSVKREAWFSIMEAATQLKDYPKVYAAWEKIKDFDPDIRVTATIGMADALSAQEKYKEALALLDGISGKLKSPDIAPVNSRIVLLAENLEDYARAMTACDALLGLPGSQMDVAMWSQKKTVLEQKAAKEKEKAVPAPAQP